MTDKALDNKLPAFICPVIKPIPSSTYLPILKLLRILPPPLANLIDCLLVFSLGSSHLLGSCKHEPAGLTSRQWAGSRPVAGARRVVTVTMDDFSDDDLDGLNDNALQELENNALQFTQAQKPHGRPAPEPLHAPRVHPLLPEAEYDFEDDDLDDAVLVVQEPLQVPLQAKSALPPVSAPAHGPAPQGPARLAPRMAPPQQRQQPQQQKETWRPVSIPTPASHLRPQPANPVSRPAAGPAAVDYRASQHVPRPRPPPSLPRPAASTTQRYQPSQAQNQTRVSSHEIATLQAQILDLKSKLTTKDGEISIVRNRLEKLNKEHERQLQIIKAQTAEQLAKQERAVEAARAAQESATTELEFTRRDLREEVVRAKRQEAPGTPKKNAAPKAWGVADGFEDVEMAGSPSKGKRGKNAGAVAGSVVEPPSKLLKTPTKSKRKRPVVDSPVMALETHSDDVIMLDDVKAHDVAMIGHMSPIMPGSVPFNVGCRQRLFTNYSVLTISSTCKLS